MGHERRMRYALHSKNDSTELRFKTLKELWPHVRANGLCSEEQQLALVGVLRQVSLSSGRRVLRVAAVEDATLRAISTGPFTKQRRRAQFPRRVRLQVP